MNTAFLTWAIALGGWILPEVGATETQPGANASAPATRLDGSDRPEGVATPPLRPAPQSGPAARRPAPHVPREQGAVMSPSHAARRQMPPIPTAPHAGMHRSPTSPGGYHGAPAGLSPYGTPLPGAAPGAAQAPYSQPGVAQHQPRRVQPATIGTGVAAKPPGRGIVKPFAGYQQLPVISPYLHLERFEGLDYDNYNTLVRPFTEQFHRNNQLQNEVRGLQNTLDQQYRSIEQMNRQMEFFDGRSQPRYFQDTGGFFPTP